VIRDFSKKKRSSPLGKNGCCHIDFLGMLDERIRDHYVSLRDYAPI